MIFSHGHKLGLLKGVIALRVSAKDKFKLSLCNQIIQGHLNRVESNSRSFGVLHLGNEVYSYELFSLSSYMSHFKQKLFTYTERRGEVRRGEER